LSLRPVYCDRGHIQLCIDGPLDLDACDSFPRFFFSFREADEHILIYFAARNRFFIPNQSRRMHEPRPRPERRNVLGRPGRPEVQFYSRNRKAKTVIWHSRLFCWYATSADALVAKRHWEHKHRILGPKDVAKLNVRLERVEFAASSKAIPHRKQPDLFQSAPA
jgi:hypothetical protein